MVIRIENIVNSFCGTTMIAAAMLLPAYMLIDAVYHSFSGTYSSKMGINCMRSAATAWFMFDMGNRMLKGIRD